MNKKTIIIIIVILLAGNIFFGYEFFTANRDLKQAQASLSENKTNGKILVFTQLFVDKVLKAESEIDFETRLKLENSVRDLNDPIILAQWQKFTGSKTETEAQIETKNLLELLVNKINRN